MNESTQTKEQKTAGLDYKFQLLNRLYNKDIPNTTRA